jgi:hypothetical protein
MTAVTQDEITAERLGLNWWRDVPYSRFARRVRGKNSGWRPRLGEGESLIMERVV